MPQFNDTELTAAVIKSFEETPDPRVKFLLEELVKSLHEYVRKTDLSFDEWGYAIDFLTRTGQKCTASRQEFILLPDVLGVSIMPVREAVSRLVADKALEVTPNRAVRVPLMSAEQFRDLTKVRIAIEGEAAAQAAQQRTEPDLC